MVGVLIMNITLGKEFERRIKEKVSEGLYTSASEVIRDVYNHDRALIVRFPT